MNLKKILGIALMALPLISGCVDLTVNTPTGNPNTKYKTFGFGATKSLVYFEWKDGQQICVYSLDSEGKIMFKDTCTVTNSKKNRASITAEVATEAVRYYACYPFDAINAEVEETPNENYKIRYGTFENATILTANEPSDATTLFFYPAMSLVSIGSSTIFGIESIVDMKLHFYIKEIDDVILTVPASFKFSDSNPYYIPISNKTVTCTKFTATVNVFGAKTITRYPTKQLEVGHIYPYNFSFVR